jgi:hypothetical protein
MWALAQSGKLEMCVASGWRYKWERVSVRAPGK